MLCTPPNKEGKVNPAILYAARVAGVSKIFKAGGVQAIGAMAYGTESVPKVYKIFGPGNQYVMAAKQQVSLDEVAIDMPAGPSEVCVLADETANAEFVAAEGSTPRYCSPPPRRVSWKRYTSRLTNNLRNYHVKN